MKLSFKYGISIRSNTKKCCLCLGNALPINGGSQLYLVDKKCKKKVYTELGKMLVSILKLSNSTLTRYCCQVCVETVVKCFDALLEINVAASLACQQLSVKEGGSFQCYRCNDVLESIETFTDHFKCHLLDVCENNFKDNDFENDVNKTDSNHEKSNKKNNCGSEDDLHPDDLSDASDSSRSKVVDNEDDDKCKRNLCHECGKSFGTVHSLKVHIKRHDPHYKRLKRKSRMKGIHLCEKCGKSFTTIETLRVHREKHDTTCTICGKSMYKKYIENHLLLHAKELPARLHVEKKPTNRMSSSAPKSTPLQCDHCEKSYDDRFLLVNHIAMMHGGRFDKGQKRGKRRGIECSVCGLLLHSQPKLKKHKIEEHGVTAEDRIQCEICRRWYAGKMCLRTHIKYEHMQIKPYSCKLCPKVFKRHQGLWAHMRAHENVRPYECGVCQVRFRQRYEVVNHLSKHVRAGDVNLNEAFAKTIIKEDQEPIMLYLKDQKVKQVSKLILKLQASQ